jgi:hypothetical protein
MRWPFVLAGVLLVAYAISRRIWQQSEYNSESWTHNRAERAWKLKRS